ncbi:MAG: 23S rRNA (guanosine(2251)-2'-O)-methyltransferase RlmB, partial [Thermotoga sp.]
MRVYGRRILEEALKSGIRIKKVFFAKLERYEKGFLELVEEVERRGIKYHFAEKEKLTSMVGKGHQGVVMDIEDFKYSDLEEVLNVETPFFVLLDHIQDPHNLGAIIRSAAGAGATGVIIPKDRSVKVTPAVVKVSAGAVFKIPIVLVTNLARTIEALKERDVWVYAVDMDGKPYYEEDLTGPVGVVFGSEGKGLGKL